MYKIRLCSFLNRHQCHPGFISDESILDISNRLHISSLSLVLGETYSSEGKSSSFASIVTGSDENLNNLVCGQPSRGSPNSAVTELFLYSNLQYFGRMALPDTIVTSSKGLPFLVLTSFLMMSRISRKFGPASSALTSPAGFYMQGLISHTINARRG